MLKAEEKLHWASHHYLLKQKDITKNMRGILIDWIVEVHYKWMQQAEALYLTVNLVDRFLEREVAKIKELQLIGITAMYISSKFEDVKPLRLSELVYITDNTYTEQEVLITEKQMLTTLEFDLVVPSSYRFLERFANVSHAQSELFHH